MKRSTIFILATLLLAGTAAAQQKQRVAVMNFDYATVQTYVSSIFGANQDIGKESRTYWSTSWCRTASSR
jgi:hypothetical protein